MTVWFKPRAFKRTVWQPTIKPNNMIRPSKAAAMPITIDPVAIAFKPDVEHQLKTLAAHGAPFEVGGLIYKRQRVVQYQNIAPLGERYHTYEMEVELNKDVMAIWHSHPHGPPEISSDDIETMSSMFRYFGFRWPWVVVTPNIITTWQVNGSST